MPQRGAEQLPLPLAAICVFVSKPTIHDEYADGGQVSMTSDGPAKSGSGRWLTPAQPALANARVRAWLGLVYFLNTST